MTRDLEDEPPEGGDAACWADRVCPECGQLAETAPPARCPRCGHELDDR